MNGRLSVTRRAEENHKKEKRDTDRDRELKVGATDNIKGAGDQREELKKRSEVRLSRSRE